MDEKRLASAIESSHEGIGETLCLFFGPCKAKGSTSTALSSLGSLLDMSWASVTPSRAANVGREGLEASSTHPCSTASVTANMTPARTSSAISAQAQRLAHLTSASRMTRTSCARSVPDLVGSKSAGAVRGHIQMMAPRIQHGGNTASRVRFISTLPSLRDTYGIRI